MLVGNIKLEHIYLIQPTAQVSGLLEKYAPSSLETCFDKEWLAKLARKRTEKTDCWKIPFTLHWVISRRFHSRYCYYLAFLIRSNPSFCSSSKPQLHWCTADIRYETPDERVRGKDEKPRGRVETFPRTRRGNSVPWSLVQVWRYFEVYEANEVTQRQNEGWYVNSFIYAGVVDRMNNSTLLNALGSTPPADGRYSSKWSFPVKLEITVGKARQGKELIIILHTLVAQDGTSQPKESSYLFSCRKNGYIISKGEYFC